MSAVACPHCHKPIRLPPPPPPPDPEPPLPRRRWPQVACFVVAGLAAVGTLGSLLGSRHPLEQIASASCAVAVTLAAYVGARCVEDLDR